jgi:hypothetical protein
MHLDLRRGAAATVLLLLLLATASDQGVRVPFSDDRNSGGWSAAIRSASSVIIRWPEAPRSLAGLMIKKYGKPDEMVSSQLSWNDRVPWTRIVVFRDPEAPGRADHLLQSVAYGKVALDRWRELTSIGRGAVYDPVTQELSARSDREETNYLALNLADEVVRGRRSASAARGFYDATLNLSLYGKSSPYMSRLLFRPGRPTLPTLTDAGGT